MAKKRRAGKPNADEARATVAAALSAPAGRPSSLIDTRVIYCGDCLEQLEKLPEKCIDLIYIDPPFNSNRTVEDLGEVFWDETKDRHASRARSMSR